MEQQTDGLDPKDPLAIACDLVEGYLLRADKVALDPQATEVMKNALASAQAIALIDIAKSLRSIAYGERL